MLDTDKILSVLEDVLTNSETYVQSVVLVACFVTSYLSYRLVRKFFFPKIIAFSLRRNVEMNRFITKYFIPMTYPAFTVLILFVGILVAPLFLKSYFLLSFTFKLFSLFAFLRFMRISTDSTFIANFIGFFLMPALIFQIFGVLNEVIAYLDGFALEVGAIRISVYIAIKSIIVLMIVFWFSGLVTSKSKSYIDANKNIKSSTKVIIGKFIDIFVYCAVAVIVLKTVGVDMTTFAVVGGAVGVGIGFGLQKIASNFISGIILLFERSIEVGDWVEIDNGMVEGIVKYFGGRYTLIECFDGKEIMVPNEDFIINRVNNWTYSNNRARIEVKFSVAHGSDLQKAVDLAIEVAKEDPRCLNYPEIDCFVMEFSEFAVDMRLSFWVSDITKGRLSAKSDAYIRITRKFKENNIEIPIPKREVHVKEG